MYNRFSVRLIKICPYFNTITVRFIYLRTYKSESIHSSAVLKAFPNKKEGQSLIDLLFVGLSFQHLKNEPTSLLVLFVFPFGFDAGAEELDGVDAFGNGLNVIAV
jgi:hypothetical protein